MLADKAGKMLCVNNLGELVKNWREANGLDRPALAKLIGDGVTRQQIEQLEKVGERLPKYIVSLARAMGTTVDDLLALKMPPAIGATPAASPGPQESNETSPDRHANHSGVMSDSDRAILTAVKILYTTVEIDDMKSRAMAKLEESAALLRKDLMEQVIRNHHGPDATPPANAPAPRRQGRSQI